MDQDYERRLLRQINHQNLPEGQLSRECYAASSPVSVKSGDRFIPARAGSNWSINFHYANENCRSHNQNHRSKDAGADTGKDAAAYSALLRNELLGAGIETVPDPHTDDRRHAVLSQDSHSLFRYTIHAKRVPSDGGNEVSPYSLSPLSNKSHKLLRSPRKPARKISKIPFKVLDAPELQDDFYLNLVDWSAGNLLSVGLGACVYLWSACTSQVTRLCDLSVDGDSVTSVCWNERGSLVAVGTHKGFVQIWDAAGGRKLTSLEGHSARVGALAWNGEQLSSGSRDRVILQRDIRTPPSAERRLQGHRQEVCGLKWSPDHQHLASGGNDNKLLVWNSSSLLPVQQYSDHLAAVKAIAWSPHQHGLLASGGGTADRCLRFWNTLTGQALQSTDTGSQVCNLAWSKHANELVRRHLTQRDTNTTYNHAQIFLHSPPRPYVGLNTEQHRILINNDRLCPGEAFSAKVCVCVCVYVTDGPGEHTWLLAEPDPGVEVPVPHTGRQADRPLVPRALPGRLPRWGGHSKRRGRRDAEVLERVQ
ncbi:fizzy-related protein homolog isoform X1 [Denticeps clupeoides]|uniref:fizzy-related protein homolog isoform X1 n=1 Tax=Denticeps clupeoides TaxID=299321 RepID=UPI0010A2EB3E|nr:fizzy-related protein homolog isoform X1 [Denticeps clupeoides]